MVRHLALLLALTVTSLLSTAQKCSVGFYNVENLCDTVASIFYDDSAFTPHGTKHWDTNRYRTKLANISRVLDDMSLDIAALAEVENEAVVRDLVATLKTDYNYIHRTTNDTRGMDVTILYKGDKFFPERIQQINLQYKRQGLYVKGKLLGERIDLIAVHMPSHGNSDATRERSLRALYHFADSLRTADPLSRIIIIGDMNATTDEKVMRRAFHTNENVQDGKIFLFNPLSTLRGIGSYAFRNNWQLIDNVFLSTSFLSGMPLHYHRSGVFIRDYMLSSEGSRRGYPLATFTLGGYSAGFSDHLPIFFVLDK